MALPRHLRERREDIRRLAGRYGARNLRIFGSIARETASSSSDLDILVAMDPDRTLLDLVALEQDLSELLGLPVDVVVEGGLSPHLAERILREAVPL